MSKKKGASRPPPPKPPLDPEQIFRHAVCFAFSANMLEQSAKAVTFALARAGDAAIKHAPPTPTKEELLPSGIYVVHAEQPADVVTFSVDREMLTRVPTLIPKIVLHAFATELFLKCILVIDKPTVWPEGHQLMTELFPRLEPARKTRLTELYDANCRKDPAFEQMKKDMPDSKHTLTDALQEMDRAFTKWRYAYEPPSPKTGMYGAPWDAAKTLILELRPKWGEFFRV